MKQAYSLELRSEGIVICSNARDLEKYPDYPFADIEMAQSFSPSISQIRSIIFEPTIYGIAALCQRTGKMDLAFPSIVSSSIV